MTNKRTIAVTGGTGMQGGGLVRAILNDPEQRFTPRVLTRNPESEKAKTLERAGVEIVQADLDDIESVERAFGGAYGAFCVTNYWEHTSPERETQQAKNCAAAAKAAQVEHVIWSTLEDTREFVPLNDDRMPTLSGRYKVPHFDAKAEADAEFIRLEVPTTFLVASFYWENIFGAGPQPGPDGTLLYNLPMGSAPLGGIAAEDIGKCAFGIFAAGKSYVGRTVGIAGENLTGDEMAAAMSDAIGREIHYNPVPPDVYRAFGFPGADDLGNMFQFYQEFSADVLGLRSIEEARKLNPELQTFRQWLRENGQRIPIG